MQLFCMSHYFLCCTLSIFPLALILFAANTPNLISFIHDVMPSIIARAQHAVHIMGTQFITQHTCQPHSTSQHTTRTGQERFGSLIRVCDRMPKYCIFIRITPGPSLTPYKYPRFSSKMRWQLCLYMTARGLKASKTSPSGKQR